jgi:hypothetical protein
VSKKKDKRKESLREICMKKKRKKCNGFSLIPMTSIEEDLTTKSNTRSSTFVTIGQTRKRGKKRMRGKEGEGQNSLLSSKFELMFTFFQLEERKFRGLEGK